MNELLADANSRDAKLARERIDSVLLSLDDAFEESFTSLMGGSVAKHTYVDGLSDVDALVVVNGTQFEGTKPESVLAQFASVLGKENPDAEVSVGKMAVTMRFNDGMELQLLPAIRTSTGLRIPSSRTEEWSNVVKPKKFQETLSHLNNLCGSKLVPTIKLAKSVIAGLPSDNRLSGYHIESLAIEVFKNYRGVHTTKEMLPHFFRQAKGLVAQPIADSTGQSRHVDDYLGPSGSPMRRDSELLLDRISKRFDVAEATRSVQQWRMVFE
ncbi:CBASS oligonucleotide cyclase [Hyphomonas neptunium]|uniref:CBASS oligonucleotide cyclase n=1 Tax=Hyphomonas neptunium TaxID=81032 RepID=UPI001F382E18|nr:CBASS oligonucleotide cyclase [Hyphomonas neptunium]